MEMNDTLSSNVSIQLFYRNNRKEIEKMFGDWRDCPVLAVFLFDFNYTYPPEKPTLQAVQIQRTNNTSLGVFLDESFCSRQRPEETKLLRENRPAGIENGSVEY